jgi:hypothetical protein
MNERADVERLVDAWLREEAPIRADAIVLAGAMDRIGSVAQRRRRIVGPSAGRSPRLSRLRLVLVAAAVVAAVGALLTVGPRRSELGTPSSMPSAPMLERSTREWAVPPRSEQETDAVDIPLVLGPDARWNGSGWDGWHYLDPVGDVATGAEWVDIRRVGAFKMLLAEDPHLPMIDPAERRIAYGFVIDQDEDETPDLQLGMDNLVSGGVRAWLTDLKTGRTTVKCYPRPRREPACAVDDGLRGLSDYFYPYASETWYPGPWFFYFGPSSRFYAWASIIEDGQVVATDYAPDAGWLVAGADPGIPLVGPVWSRVVEIPEPEIAVYSTLTFTHDGRVLVDACFVGGGNVTVAEDTLQVHDLALTDRPCSSAISAVDAPLRAILQAEVIQYHVLDGVLTLTAAGASLSFTGTFEGAPPDG